MKRRLFNVLSGMSLVLCVATAALWVRSDYVTDIAVIRRVVLASGRAQLSIDVFLTDETETKYYTRGPIDLRDRFLEGAQLSGHRWRYAAGLGFVEYGEAKIGYEHLLLFLLPDWFLCSVTLVIPLAWMVVNRQRINCHSRAHGRLCPNCGYDLRATPDRCPECGTVNPTSVSP